MKLLTSLLFALCLLLPLAGAERTLKFGKTLIFPRGQFHYNPVLNYNGRWLDVPLLRDVDMNDPKPDFITSSPALKQMGQYIKLYNADGFASLAGKNTATLMRKMRQSGVSGFVWLPEVYSGAGSAYYGAADFAKIKQVCDEVFLAAKNSPLALKLNSKTVISTYNADFQSAETWAAVKEAYRKQFGEDKFLILPLIEKPCGKPWYRHCNDFHAGKLDREGIKNHYRAYLRATDGIYVACAPSETISVTRRTDIPFFKEMIQMAQEVLAEPEFKEKLFAVAARIGHKNGTRIGRNRDSFGTWTYRETMQTALAARPDIIVIPEWDEQNENTSLRPTVENSFAFARVTRVLTGKDNGALPGDDLSIPNLILSFRRVVALGENTEVEVVALPEEGKATEAELEFVDLDGKTVWRSGKFTFSGKVMEEKRFLCDSTQWAAHRALRPRLTLKRDGKTQIFFDGLPCMLIEALANNNYKYTKLPLRDLLPGSAEVVRTNSGYLAKGASETEIAHAELLCDNFAAATASPDGKPHWLDTPQERVIVLHFQNQGNNDDKLRGTLTLANCGKGQWLKDTTYNSPSVKPVPFSAQSVTLKAQLRRSTTVRYMLKLSPAEAEKAVLKIDCPKLFKAEIPIKTILEKGIYGVPSQGSATLTVNRANYQLMEPSNLHTKSVTFESDPEPRSLNSVFFLRLIGANGKIRYSAPVPVSAQRGEMVQVKVWGDKAKAPLTLQVAAAAAPKLSYRPAPEYGTAIPSKAGRRYRALGGGYAAQVTGECGAGRDSTLFINQKEFPNRGAGSVTVTADGWKFDHPGQHLIFPSGVVPRRAAFTLTIKLVQSDAAKSQTIAANCVQNYGLFKILAIDGKLKVEMASELNPNYTKLHETGLSLTLGKEETIVFDYDLDRFTISCGGKKFTAPAFGPGINDTVTAFGGSKHGWFKGTIRAIDFDFTGK